MTDRYTADQIEAKKVDGLWPVQRPGERGGALDWRIGRGMIHVIAGKPDKGKGLTVVRIGADLVQAGYTVLHSAIEDSPALITKPRYQAAGVRGEALKRVHLRRFRLPEQMQELFAWVERDKIDCIIIDPLASHLSGGITRHSDRIREVTDPLTAFIETTPTHPAVIVVEHAVKGVKRLSDPLEAIGGSSSGLPAATRMGYIVGVDPDNDDRRIMCHVKGNVVERRPAMAFELDITPVEIKTVNDDTGDVETEQVDYPALLFDDECVFDPMRLLQGSDGRKAPGTSDKRAQACESLTNYLFLAWQNGLPKVGEHPAIKPKAKGVPAGRVFEDMKQRGHTEKTLRRAKAEMGVEVNPPGGGRTAVWTLPQAVLQLLAGGDVEPEKPKAVPKQKKDDLDDDLKKLLGGDQ